MCVSLMNKYVLCCSVACADSNKRMHTRIQTNVCMRGFKQTHVCADSNKRMYSYIKCVLVICVHIHHQHTHTNVTMKMTRTFNI